MEELVAFDTNCKVLNNNGIYKLQKWWEFDGEEDEYGLNLELSG
jgi:hypothetical protein